MSGGGKDSEVAILLLVPFSDVGIQNCCTTSKLEGTQLGTTDRLTVAGLLLLQTPWIDFGKAKVGVPKVQTLHINNPNEEDQVLAYPTTPKLRATFSKC